MVTPGATSSPRLVTPTGVLVMPAAADRTAWLGRRRQGVGSSDVPAILGVSVYKSARRLYFEKTGQLPEDEEVSEPALWGNLHEETVAREWARRNKAVVRRIGLVAHAEHRWALCTLDRLVVECPLDRTVRNRCCLEVKTRNAWVAGQWRGGVPDDVHAQNVWEMFVPGFDHVHVACLIGGNDYRQYVIRRDEELEQATYHRALEFWFDRVSAGDPPPDAELDDPNRSLDLEERLHPNRDGVLRMSDKQALEAVELLHDYRELGGAAAKIKHQRDLAKLRLVRLLGDNSAAVADNELVYSFDEVGAPRKVDLDKLLEQYPDAYRGCVEERTGRRINVAKKYKEAGGTDAIL